MVPASLPINFRGGRASDFPSENFSLGNFHVPAKHPPLKKWEHIEKQISVSEGAGELSRFYETKEVVVQALEFFRVLGLYGRQDEPEYLSEFFQ